MKKSEKYIKQFLGGTLISWIVSLLILTCALILVTSGNYGDAGSMLQGTLGVAVAFAGAFVAIKIASVANNTIHAQMEREELTDWRTNVNQAMTEHTKVRITFERPESLFDMAELHVTLPNEFRLGFIQIGS